MRLTEKYKKFIDILQWILIGLMMLICASVYMGNIEMGNKNDTMQRENSYFKIYNSKKINELTKRNKELNDSILRLNEKLDALSEKQ